jgi:hypothetical protein
MITAVTVEASARTPSSGSEMSDKATARGGPSAASPNSANPPGRPSVMNSTRIACTMAMPRELQPNSADNAKACAIDPGLAPSNADSMSQRCTRRR